jgi:hypothetical protein
MSLQEEIDRHRKEIHTDGYPMSIGEVMNLYRDGELEIHPEFQRFFRWSSKQKSRWIESILLGIPLPSIFVSQREDGVWDVIDGLQRLSTILEVAGELKDDSGKKKPALVLDETPLLPSLKGKQWKTLSEEQRRFIKRAKLDLKIILRESHESSKYELFRRLNTGGSFLSDQELRSAFLVGANRDFFRWIVELAQLESFRSCLLLSENQLQQQYELELVVRFLVFRRLAEDRLAGIDELGEYLTDKILAAAATADYPQAEHEKAFRTVFEALAPGLGENSFRKFEPSRKAFSGAFSISAFEVIALGLGYHYKKYLGRKDAAAVADIVMKKVWTKPDFLTSSGVSATQRIPRTVVRGRELFER